MKLFERIERKMNGKQLGPFTLVNKKFIRAGWDAADKGGTLDDHWRKANNKPPITEATPAELRLIRARVRHEFNNNSYCRGIVNTVANYVIGTGPKLRLVPRGSVASEDRRTLYEYANLFNDWAWEIDLARKLRVAYCAKIKDGEGFLSLGTRIIKGAGITLNVKPFECDLVSHNDFMRDPGLPDGVNLDRDGNITSYEILPRHPGNASPFTFTDKPKQVPAGEVVHMYDETRPGLVRGISEIVAGLRMFAQLSRYSSAVVASAEAEAEITAVLKTQAPPSTGVQKVNPNEYFTLEHNTILSLPGGWELQYVPKSQPGQNHEAFLRTIIRDFGRGIGVPYAVAAADASGHNYSSMRGDWQGFYEEIKVRRNDVEHSALEKIFAEFNKEARLVFDDYGKMPQDFDYYWDWPGYEHVDPLKVANAQRVKLENKTTTLAREYAAQGLFYEDEIEQLKYEQGLTKDLVTVTKAANRTTPAADGGEDDQSNERGEDDQSNERGDE